MPRTRLVDALSLCAGYELLWLETMVLASDQIPATNFFSDFGMHGIDLRWSASSPAELPWDWSTVA